MKKRIANAFIIICLSIGGFAFAIINISGVEYNEAMMPVYGHGTDLTRVLVIGNEISIVSPTISSENTRIFSINGISYIDADVIDIPVSEDNRYYIVHQGKTAISRFTVDGINDWTTQEYTQIKAPYKQVGKGNYFYSTSTSIDTVLASNLDFLMINNVEYSNGIITDLPDRVNWQYYIYYSSTQNSAELKVKEYSPKLNLKLFVEGGL